MFTVEEYAAGRVQIRREHLTGLTARLSPERIKRDISPPYAPPPSEECPFCPGRVEHETPTFSDGTRIRCGESVTFPNLYPFASWHVVTVITGAHAVDRFSRRHLEDAFRGISRALSGRENYASINWNYLPSAGASIAHPHLQGIADPGPTALQGRYIRESRRYFGDHGRSYWADLVEHERTSDRFLFEDDGLVWFANSVSVGEREVRGILPATTPEDLGPSIPALARGVLRVIECYRALGTRAFNMAVYFGRPEDAEYFSAFCSLIARVNPNPSSMTDSAFMERLHLEPVVMTLPESLGRTYREMDAEGLIRV
ncbi:galactose-1-phosphate uridylyltransferase [Methanofollis formosanus]|uniref:Galactose-1-phosphate uridylyltransferase n=1 Tax=Methanofollis formosanus TaxID=299308 RepID=A0A8G1A2Y3_9EURY|nr:galactose-1-phosphate uridylyltransferase [Methanofollis formosanus]QYZ79107.1 galactose-1-phosphate uridylyltransferase [Methanofollis formosanus]